MSKRRPGVPAKSKISGGGRPGRLWLFFYGRKRRGFPGLLVALIVVVVALGAIFGLPNGAAISRFAIVLSVSALALVILAALALVVIGTFRPPRGGRKTGRR